MKLTEEEFEYLTEEIQSSNDEESISIKRDSFAKEEDKIDELNPTSDKEFLLADFEDLDFENKTTIEENESFTSYPSLPQITKEVEDSSYEENKKHQKKEIKKKSKKGSKKKLYNWINGNILLRPLLKRRYIYLFLEIAILFYIYISIGLHRIDKISKIDRLEEQLRQLEYRQLFIMGELGKLDREETIMQKLQSQNSLLQPDNDPPFVIYYNRKEFEKELKSRYKLD